MGVFDAQEFILAWHGMVLPAVIRRLWQILRFHCFWVATEEQDAL